MNIPIEDGVEIISPDENYVLTQDNLTKIMGIQTRFRYIFDLLISVTYEHNDLASQLC